MLNLILQMYSKPIKHFLYLQEHHHIGFLEFFLIIVFIFDFKNKSALTYFNFCLYIHLYK